jgi:hypothetical protein
MESADQVVCDKRYVVIEGAGTEKRPFGVKDTKGGWICSAHKSLVLAQKRADELNSVMAAEGLLS